MTFGPDDGGASVSHSLKFTLGLFAYAKTKIVYSWS
jgi:aryl-alcohol dehydrogenase-like predicted oxidoreductase